MRTRSPQNRGGAHVPAGPVRPSPDERPWRTMFAATVSAFCTPCANPVPSVAAHIVRHKMRTPALQSRGGAHVPAGPVRLSPDERPWRTMFAATVSAFCTSCAKPVPPVAAHIVRHKMRTRSSQSRSGAHVPAGRRGGAANGPRDSRTARDLVQCAQDPAPFVVRMVERRPTGPGTGRLPAAGAAHPPGADKAARRGRECPGGTV